MHNYGTDRQKHHTLPTKIAGSQRSRRVIWLSEKGTQLKPISTINLKVLWELKKQPYKKQDST